MAIYLTVNHTYNEVQIGLFEDSACIQNLAIHKHQISSTLSENIRNLIERNNKRLVDLSFIAINQGPGPFTTLRVVLSTINGFSFSLGTPMIGIDGIKTLNLEYHNNHTTIALLNAFSQDIYFSIYESGNEVQTGYDNISLFLNRIQEQFKNESSVTFLGNGAIMHSALIKQTLPLAMVSQTITTCSLHAIAQEALKKWEKKEYTTLQLQPLYLKNVIYNNSIKVK